MRVFMFVETFEIFTYIYQKIVTGGAGFKMRSNIIPHLFLAQLREMRAFVVNEKNVIY
jgi:hypothetical protein